MIRIRNIKPKTDSVISGLCGMSQGDIVPLTGNRNHKLVCLINDIIDIGKRFFGFESLAVYNNHFNLDTTSNITSIANLFTHLANNDNKKFNEIINHFCNTKNYHENEYSIEQSEKRGTDIRSFIESTHKFKEEYNDFINKLNSSNTIGGLEIIDWKGETNYITLGKIKINKDNWNQIKKDFLIKQNEENRKDKKQVVKDAGGLMRGLKIIYAIRKSGKQVNTQTIEFVKIKLTKHYYKCSDLFSFFQGGGEQEIKTIPDRYISDARTVLKFFCGENLSITDKRNKETNIHSLISKIEL